MPRTTMAHEVSQKPRVIPGNAAERYADKQAADLAARDSDYEKYERAGILFHEPDFADNVFQTEPFIEPEEYESEEERSYDDVLGPKSSIGHLLRNAIQGDVYNTESAEDMDASYERVFAEQEWTGVSEFTRKRVDLDAEADVFESEEPDFENEELEEDD